MGSITVKEMKKYISALIVILSLVLALFYAATADMLTPAKQATSATTMKDDTTQAKKVVIKVQVNVNTADAQELTTLLNGVGMSKAQAIVQYRQKTGKFTDANSLNAG